MRAGSRIYSWEPNPAGLSSSRPRVHPGESPETTRMKFVCERCHTRYSIADDKVRQKILKIRCKTCDNVITVRDPGSAAVSSAAVAAVAPPPPPPRNAPVGPAAAREWFVAVNGEQTGPLNRVDAA